MAYNYVMRRVPVRARLAAAVLLACAGLLQLVGGDAATAVVPTAVIPPGYTEVPGTPDAVLRPSHRGSVGSTFTQDCSGPGIPLPPTGVVWHFILPQKDRSLYAPNPDNIFVSLTVRFAAAGEVTLTAFGPPSAAHGWIATPTDDVLLDGFADGAERNGDGFPPLFNLSHTCAAPGVVPPATTTTTSTTTTSTTAPPTLDQLTITKAVIGSAAGGQGPIVIEIHCTPPNGPIPPWEIPAGATGTLSTVVTGITTPAQCVTTEVENGENDQVIVLRGDSPGIRLSGDLCPTGVGSPRELPSVGFENVVEPRPTTTTTLPPVTEPSYPPTTPPATTLPPVIPPDECEVPEVDPPTTVPTTTTPTTTTPGVAPPTTSTPTTSSTTPVAPTTSRPAVVPPTLPSTGSGWSATTAVAWLALAAGLALVVGVARRPS